MIKIYKDNNNKVHEIEEGFENLLPSGSIEIIQEEAILLLAPSAAEQLLINETLRVEAIKNEALSRINILFPYLSNLDQLEFFVEFWKSITANAKAATVEFQGVINIYSTATAAIKDGITIVTDIVWP